MHTGNYIAHVNVLHMHTGYYIAHVNVPHMHNGSYNAHVNTNLYGLVTIVTHPDFCLYFNYLSDMHRNMDTI